MKRVRQKTLSCVSRLENEKLKKGSMRKGNQFPTQAVWRSRQEHWQSPVQASQCGCLNQPLGHYSATLIVKLSSVNLKLNTNVSSALNVEYSKSKFHWPYLQQYVLVTVALLLSASPHWECAQPSPIMKKNSFPKVSNRTTFIKYWTIERTS